MARKTGKRGKDKRPRKRRADAGNVRVAEKRRIASYTLPPRFAAALAAVAQARTERTGAPVSASAVLASLLARHIADLEEEAGTGV
jgi:hypothetical protein